MFAVVRVWHNCSCQRSRSSAKACASNKTRREVAFNAQHALCKRARVLKCFESALASVSYIPLANYRFWQSKSAFCTDLHKQASD